YASLMRKLMVLETIAWSRDIYVAHVSGIRQYSMQESAAQETAPSVSTSAIASTHTSNSTATSQSDRNSKCLRGHSSAVNLGPLTTVGSEAHTCTPVGLEHSHYILLF
ncbi:unnamed protein product, partial [Heterotrigona itama]